MNTAFIIIGEGLDCTADRARIGNEHIQVSVYGVDNLEMACGLARSLRGRVDLIELCGGFDERMTRRVIEAAGGEIPVGHVTHFASEERKYQRLFAGGGGERIRPYQTGDEARIMEIWLSANLDAHGFLPASYWQENYDAVRQVYLPGSRTYVWEGREGIAGFVSLLAGSFVGALFVDRAFRSKGIGFALIEHCKRLSPSLTVTVYAENSRAVAFYKRCGFQVAAEQPAGDTGHLEYLMSWKREESTD